jgi:hypothetical protein
VHLSFRMHPTASGSDQVVIVINDESSNLPELARGVGGGPPSPGMGYPPPIRVHDVIRGRNDHYPEAAKVRSEMVRNPRGREFLT